MYAFRIDRVTHFSLTRQNASLCGRAVNGGIELDRLQGLICSACAFTERDNWVSEWQRRYGVLGPIKSIVDETDRGNSWLAAEKWVA